jgi:quercetin dioxygenase-like cupin family protein
MLIDKLSRMKGGWFVGDFLPSVMQRKDFEVGYKLHKKGERWPKHIHKIATEITVLIRGKMTIQGQLLESGDIFVIYPDEVADPEFLEDCEIIIVKTPSVIGDKYEV